MAYTAEVIDHFEHPRFAGELEGAAARVRASNPVCGDILELAANVEGSETGRQRISEVRFKAKGCVAAMAAGSWLAERIAGAEIASLRNIKREEIVAGLGGLSSESMHVSHIAIEALTKLAAALDAAR